MGSLHYNRDHPLCEMRGRVFLQEHYFYYYLYWSSPKGGVQGTNDTLCREQPISHKSHAENLRHICDITGFIVPLPHSPALGSAQSCTPQCDLWEGLFLREACGKVIAALALRCSTHSLQCVV